MALPRPRLNHELALRPLRPLQRGRGRGVAARAGFPCDTLHVRCATTSERPGAREVAWGDDEAQATRAGGGGGRGAREPRGGRCEVVHQHAPDLDGGVNTM
jgi:hypothetical protein